MQNRLPQAIIQPIGPAHPCEKSDGLCVLPHELGSIGEVDAEIAPTVVTKYVTLDCFLQLPDWQN